MKLKNGFSLLELVLAIAIFSVSSIGLATMLIDANLSTKTSSDRIEALLYAKEGVEAVRAIRDADWTDLTDGNHGLISSGGVWAFSGSSDTIASKYTRTVNIEAVSASTKNVSVTVAWDITVTRPVSVVLTTVLTNWVSATVVGGGGGGGGSSTYTVTYDGNGNTGGTAPTDATAYTSGETVTVLGEGDLVKSYSDFLGWNTSADGSGTDVATSSTFAIATNVSLYAKWSASSWLTGWSYRKKITIDNANVDADLTNFPLLVSIAETGGGATNIGYNLSDTTTGYDIRFTDSTGATLLKYERESFSVASANLTANFWVKVPTVATASDTDIYIYYGKSAATDGQDPTNVWDANFAAVYHLKETGTGATGDYQDSTSNNNDSTNTTGQPTVDASGKIGNAETFDGNTSHINLGHNASLNTNTAATFSFWMKANSWSGDSGLLTRMYSWGSTNSDFLIYHRSSNVSFCVTPDGNANNVTCLTDTQEITDTTTWHEITVRYNGSTIAFYTDGQASGSADYSSGIYFSSGIDTLLGRQYSNSGFASNSMFNGTLDEVRVSNSARAAEWIKFEYHNQGDTGNNLTFNSQESL